MESRWSDDDAGAWPGDAALRVYSSRLLGADDSLVLHGGGNTSAKLTQRDVLGVDQEILFVKGTGWNLGTITEKGFAPVRLEHLRRLAGLPQLSDPEMLNEMLTHTTVSGAPAPSVEAILHAILPYKFVDHTHADALISVSNSEDGEARVREVYSDVAVIIPYVMPGFDLARLVAAEFPVLVTSRTIGIVLMNHGLFSFGDTARESYERMIELVDRAEKYLETKKTWRMKWSPKQAVRPDSWKEIPGLRKEISDVAGFPVIVSRQCDDRSLAFAQRDDVQAISQRGPATPDHVIRTKRIPQYGRDVANYAAQYAEYFARREPLAKERKKMLDPAPRVIVDPALGVCAVGKSAGDARIVADIYAHTIDIIGRSEGLGGFRPLPEKDIFDVEYWDLEQAKLNRAPTTGHFAGEIALVTGGASGIGKACVEAFLFRGAAVVALDVDPGITQMHDRADYLGVVCDVTSDKQLSAAIASAVNAFGGLDMLVLNAGIFPASRPIQEISSEEWRKVMAVNLDSNLSVLRLAHPLLKLAPRGGRIAVIGSKNVPAPGPGAAAYSASKAALNQLARVVALEWGGDGIRINSLHPHGVFDTGLWSDAVLQSRADQYGMTVDQYRKNNILKTEISSGDVAELAAELCGPLFAKSTGLQLAVDGGSDRVI